MSLGERVHAARTKSSLTQQQLATAAGTSSGVISEIERGVYKSPGIDLVRRIADALGVSIDSLVHPHPEPAYTEPAYTRTGEG